MKPAFKKDGTVTAGNASGINDGAAFFVLADAAVAAAHGHKPMARLAGYAVAGVPNEIMGEGPIPATKLALKKAGLRLDQMDVIESNEAFAAQAIAVARGLEFDMAKVNPNGGAIALGPPHRLQRRLPGHQGRLRTAPHRRALCAGDDVHRRRPGHRGGLRAPVNMAAKKKAAPPPVNPRPGLGRGPGLPAALAGPPAARDRAARLQRGRGPPGPRAGRVCAGPGR